MCGNILAERDKFSIRSKREPLVFRFVGLVYYSKYIGNGLDCPCHLKPALDGPGYFTWFGAISDHMYCRYSSF